MAEDGVSGGSSSGGGVTGCGTGSGSSNGRRSEEAGRVQLLQEMQEKKFDGIRFASYRTACKLRFIQTKTNREHTNKLSVYKNLERDKKLMIQTGELS